MKRKVSHRAGKMATADFLSVANSKADGEGLGSSDCEVESRLKSTYSQTRTAERAEPNSAHQIPLGGASPSSKSKPSLNPSHA